MILDPPSTPPPPACANDWTEADNYCYRVIILKLII